jgi:death-on-curing protein
VRVAIRLRSLAESLNLYGRVMEVGGGASAIRDLGALESALAQPRVTFSDKELYPSLAEKASALGFSIIGNHPFVDGNKGIRHAAVEVFMVLNGFELSATIDDAERVILGVAAGTTSRDEFTAWIRTALVPYSIP